MRYKISHDTTYKYSSPVSQSSHLLHLSPRGIERQTIERHYISVVPLPLVRKDMLDNFGNPFTILNLETDHSKLSVQARSTINVVANPTPDFSSSVGWEHTREQAAKSLDPDLVRFLCYSRFTTPNPEIYAYAQRSFPTGRPLLKAAAHLMARINNDFEFDGTATDVSTPVAQVFKIKKGVCQDFAHLQLTCLRALGLPARYISGYIRTYPPEGQPRLIGADASHAWISVWCAESGWVEFDPTNNKIVTDEHIAIAYGRDFLDVSPISGVILGGHKHFVDVSVDVMPLEVTSSET